MWFDDHPEWEKETLYPVKEYAYNGTGAGSGKGFYVDTIEDCGNEVRAFLRRYYPQVLQ